MFIKNYTLPVVAVATLVFFTFASLLINSASDVQAQSIECKPVMTIYARGSGQTLGESDELGKLQDKLEGVLPDSIYSIYELGTSPQNGSLYPAINVGNWRNGNAIGAGVSGGMGNDYGRSVSDGVIELTGYIESTLATCPSTQFVLAGYSQGAQVIGQALPLLSIENRSKIVFSGLFGDPKLNLPEGRGLYPPACRGEGLSLYRRDIANCRVDRGSLGYRSPYLPSDLEAKTGLWCYADDFVCGSSKNPLNTSGHGMYGGDSMAVDKAVDEAIERLRVSLPESIASMIPNKNTEIVDDTTDVVFLIDTTGSMFYQIEGAKQFAASSASDIIAKNGRVALVAYRDIGDAYTAQVVTEFTSDHLQFQAGLDSLRIGGGGDWPEALLHALMTAFNNLDWKYGVTKAAVVVTDADFHDPDLVDGTTLEDVVQRSLEIDPVNVYVLTSTGFAAGYEELTSRTSGQIIIDDGDTATALSMALTKIRTRPVVTLPLSNYAAEAGQAITFNASVIIPEGVTVTGYDWDFDGDGTFDQTTDTPTIQHTYTTTFEGFMQVRVSASNDTVGSASASVSIGIAPTEPSPESPTNLVATVTSTVNGKSTINLTWSLPVNLPDHYVLTLNGIGLGTLTSDRTSVEISDVDRSISNEIGLVGATADGTEGDMSITVVNEEEPTDAEIPPINNPRKATFPWLIDMLRRLFPVMNFR